MGRIKVILITGRSLDQGLGTELGKYSAKYRHSVTACEMNPMDMETVGVKPGDVVKISTEFGNVVLRVTRLGQELPRGVVFIPYGPWVNLIVDPKTHGTGMPSFKGVSAEVESVQGEKSFGLKELFEKTYGKE